MKSKGRAENDVVSLDNFDPTGPRDKPLDSPRTLQACKVVGVHPTELFLLDKKELAEQLGREDIEAVDQEAAYEEYVQEMQAIFDKLIAVRQEIIEKGISKKKGSKKTAGNKAKKDRSIRNYPEADELAGDDIGQLQEADLRGDEPSEGAAMNSKQLYKKKKPRKRLSNSVRPTKKMMEDFQRTQYLAAMQQAAERESSHRELTPMEKLQKVMEREQRRQKTMLQSYQNTEAKRQVLLQKMNEDLRRQHYYKNMKEGSLF